MRTKRVILILLAMVFIFTGCAKKNVQGQKVTGFSDEILVGYSAGGVGYGTVWDCLGGTVVIYKDHTVVVSVSYKDELKSTTLTMSDKDYAELEKIAVPEKIIKMPIYENNSVMDGGSCYLYLYDSNNERVLVGGYEPRGKKFLETRKKIMEIMEQYNVNGIIGGFKSELREEYEKD